MRRPAARRFRLSLPKTRSTTKSVLSIRGRQGSRELQKRRRLQIRWRRELGKNPVAADPEVTPHPAHRRGRRSQHQSWGIAPEKSPRTEMQCPWLPTPAKDDTAISNGASTRRAGFQGRLTRWIAAGSDPLPIALAAPQCVSQSVPQAPGTVRCDGWRLRYRS